MATPEEIIVLTDAVANANHAVAEAEAAYQQYLIDHTGEREAEEVEREKVNAARRVLANAKAVLDEALK